MEAKYLSWSFISETAAMATKTRSIIGMSSSKLLCRFFALLKECCLRCWSRIHRHIVVTEFTDFFLSVSISHIMSSGPTQILWTSHSCSHCPWPSSIFTATNDRFRFVEVRRVCFTGSLLVFTHRSPSQMASIPAWSRSKASRATSPPAKKWLSPHLTPART